MSEKPATHPVNEIKGFDNNDIFEHAFIRCCKISLNNRSKIFRDTRCVEVMGSLGFYAYQAYQETLSFNPPPTQYYYMNSNVLAFCYGHIPSQY